MAELLEIILVFLSCPKTLLLSQRVSVEWRNCIQASAKLQKKLFLLPITFEEALELNMPRDDSMILSIGPGSTYLFNELLVSNVAYAGGDDGGGFQLSEGVILDTVSAHRGISSWERMYLSASSGIGMSFYRFEAQTYDILAADSKDGFELSYREDELEYEEVTLRDLIDGLETYNLTEARSAIVWRLASFDFLDWAIRYSSYKLMHGLEKRFGYRTWKDIDEDNINYTNFEIDDIPRENLPREGAPPKEESSDDEPETGE